MLGGSDLDGVHNMTVWSTLVPSLFQVSKWMYHPHSDLGTLKVMGGREEHHNMSLVLK